jgi:hypothetical protein
LLLRNSMSLPEPGGCPALSCVRVRGRGPGTRSRLEHAAHVMCRCSEMSAVCTEDRTWDWMTTMCAQRRLEDDQVRELLTGRSIVLSGDSHVRFMQREFARILGKWRRACS